MYQGIPLLAKWVTAYDSNQNTNKLVNVVSVFVENLATNKDYAPKSFDPYPAPWSIGIFFFFYKKEKQRIFF